MLLAVLRSLPGSSRSALLRHGYGSLLRRGGCLCLLRSSWFALRRIGCHNRYCLHGRFCNLLRSPGSAFRLLGLHLLRSARLAPRSCLRSPLLLRSARPPLRRLVRCCSHRPVQRIRRLGRRSRTRHSRCRPIHLQLPRPPTSRLFGHCFRLRFRHRSYFPSPPFY